MRVQRLGIPFGERPRFSEQTLGDLRPPAAMVVGESRANAGRAEHIERGHADLRLVVIRERIVEEDRVAALIGTRRLRRKRPRGERRQGAAPIDAEPFLARNTSTRRCS